MDGLRPSEDVGVILTTNSIERLEAAIEDRPGHIGQCVYFGPPGRTLRRRYLAQYAKAYDYAATDVERLVDMGDGTIAGVHQGTGPSNGADRDAGTRRRLEGGFVEMTISRRPSMR